MNTRQITKYQNDKKLLEFNDFLQVVDAEQASNIHSRYSKIRLIGQDYSKGTGENNIKVEINLDPEKAKYIAESVISDNVIVSRLLEDKMLNEIKHEKKKFSFSLFDEQKILTHKTLDDGRCLVTKLQIVYNQAMNNPWNILLENGSGIAESRPNGGTSLKTGSYKAMKSVSIFMKTQEFKTQMIILRDYIRTWETINLKSILNQRDKLESEMRASKAVS